MGRQEQSRIYPRGFLDTPMARSVSHHSISEISPQGVPSELSISTERALLSDPKTKELLRVARYTQGLNLWAQIQIKEMKVPEEKANTQRELRAIEFTNSGRDKQIGMQAELFRDVDSVLAESFRTTIGLWSDLAREDNRNTDIVETEKRAKQRFQKLGRPARFEQILTIRSEIEDMFIDRYPEYLKAWAKFQLALGKPKDQIKAETINAMRNFETATRSQQVLVARDRRHRVQNAETDYFSQLEVKYASLERRGLIPTNSLTLDQWQLRFAKAASFDTQISVLRAFEYVVNRINDSARNSSRQLATAVANS